MKYIDYAESQLNILKGTAVSAFAQAALFGTATALSIGALSLSIYEGPVGAVAIGLMTVGCLYAAVNSVQKGLKRLNFVF